jgi:hypothetical protein
MSPATIEICPSQRGRTPLFNTINPVARAKRLPNHVGDAVKCVRREVQRVGDAVVVLSAVGRELGADQAGDADVANGVQGHEDHFCFWSTSSRSGIVPSEPRRGHTSGLVHDQAAAGGVPMQARVECSRRRPLRHVSVVSYCGLIPAASMIRAALSLSPSTKRVKSGCVMLIGSPPCFTSEARTAGSDRARAPPSASV